MLAPLLLLWPMSLALTWLAAQGIASLPYDRALIESVRSLGQRVEVRGDDILFDLSRETARMLRADEVDNVYYLVRGSRGEIVSGDRDLPLPPADEPRTPGQVKVRDDEIHGDSVRVAYQWIVPGSDARLMLALLADAEAAGAVLARVLWGLGGLLLLAVAVLLVWMALVRGLAPLTALQQRIRERASDDVSPIDVHEVPEEVSPLVQAINDLLERQQSSLATQKRFLADAAHQLKTPLAGLRMQAELAAREIDAGHGDPQLLRASLQQMARASQRAAHMVNQLLSMARADARAGIEARDRIDLEALATDVVRDFVPRSLDAGIDLGYEGADSQLPDALQRPGQTDVLGHALLLRELISNLVDNALHYTPRGGAVTVRVVPDPFAQTVVLQVEDSGPGIPAAERELVFQPFYRALGTTVDGSGLGLAIVAEIAHQHGSTVQLDDAREPGQVPIGEGPGARFTIRLRQAPVPEAVSPEGPAAEPARSDEIPI